jgi:glycosyltransferase involved in cell wall biosynthesis
MVLLSIITINYNNAIGLKATIESVTSQTFADFEYVIIDGGSTDKSVDIIKASSSEIDYWVSEKDNGIYHAMNKGIDRAAGEYIMFLNSGDHLISNTILEEIIPLLDKEDITYGNLVIKKGSQTWTKEYPDRLYFNYFIHDSLPHSGGSFFRRNAFREALGKYDESLKIVSDWKWFLSAIFKYNYTYKHIDKTISVFDFSGISSINTGLDKKEKQQVLENEFGNIYKDIQTLSGYKFKYETLLSSRCLQLCLKLKKLVFWK